MNWIEGCLAPIGGVSTLCKRLSAIDYVVWNAIRAWIAAWNHYRRCVVKADAVEVLEQLVGKHRQFRLMHRGRPILWDGTDRSWTNACRWAGPTDVRSQNRFHIRAARHGQVCTSVQELEGLRA